MNDEAKQILAFIFKRSGKEILPASDVYLAISMELQWCSPKEAKAFVKNAVANKLLKESDHGVTPSFEVEKVTIPTGFSPSKQLFSDLFSPLTETKEKDVYSLVMSRVKQKKQMSEEDIEQSIEKIKSEKMINKEVAAVFFAKTMQCEIQDLLSDLEKTVFTVEENKE